MRFEQHGHSNPRSETYLTWLGMRQRCYQRADSSFKYYGARGISVCARWFGYKNFLADMGKRPPGKTIHRIDNDGHYMPSNCCWATAQEQQANTRKSRLITFAGQTKSLKAWAESLDIAPCSLYFRLEKMSVEKALTRSKGRWP